MAQRPVVDDRKLAGLLAEAEGDALVVGAGNVNWESFPEELGHRDGLQPRGRSPGRP
jgi:biotin-(acetyl-CoA carboxylase) ligase